MNIYHKNIGLLKECIPGAIQEIEKLELIDKDETKVEELHGCLHVLIDEMKYQLESRQKEKEVELLTKDIDWKKENLVLVLGIGNRQLIKELSSKTKSGSKLLIYEPDMNILNYVLEHEDLTDSLVPGNILLWWGEDILGEKKGRLFEMLSMNWAKFLYNMQVIISPGYIHYMGIFKQLVKELKTKIQQYYMSLGNALDDVLQGFQQNYQNIEACLETNSMREIEGKYKGYPAIIVSAGPSLEKNIHHLKEAEGKALIISCDACWDACKIHGVKPDAIASIERGIETYQYYYEGKNFDDDLVLLAPSLVWTDLFNEFHGKKIVVSKNDDGVDGWWKQFFPDLDHINTGMSCATLAYAAAAIAGCNPIILIGQDLAYTDNKKHSSITHNEEFEGENNASEAEENLMVEDIYGNMIPTDKFYNLFRFWFEDRAMVTDKDIKLIDATEGGAKINGSVIMTFEEAIKQYCTKEKEKKLFECLSDKVITQQMLYDKCKEINQAADKVIQKLHRTKKMAKDHYETLEKIYDNNLDDEMTEKQIIKAVKKMQKGDAIVRRVIDQRETITFFQQYIAQTVAHVKELGNELTGVNVMKNLLLQGNLMGALMRGSEMLISEYEALQDSLKEKMKETGIEVDGSM